jgi:hypothetical protein
MAAPAFNDINDIDTNEDEAAEAATERAHAFVAYD